ncbi:hypothetical protein [Cerasicoccus frondis]|uniref:hypothetical protein n=1 Tax=Cerasicoccus frondis TaxID=490090 RepID=UPI002852D44E|nr:hypothetical protein [Cerasicoccus frondis]
MSLEHNFDRWIETPEWERHAQMDDRERIAEQRAIEELENRLSISDYEEDY